MQTFYVSLDLTSCNGPLKRPRRRSATPSASSENLDEPRPRDGPVLNTDPNLQIDPRLFPQEKVQIMDLHSANPVVSYQSQIFSCSWMDLLGSDLVFSFPDQHADAPVLRKDQNADLISASRVKILGQKANLISASAGVERTFVQRNQQQQQLAAEDASTLPPSPQGRFLQRLIDAKRAKGETDTVRTVFPTKRPYVSDGPLHGWSQTDGTAATTGVDQADEPMQQDNADGGTREVADGSPS
jgi:hypothetical protein